MNVKFVCFGPNEDTIISFPLALFVLSTKTSKLSTIKLSDFIETSVSIDCIVALNGRSLALALSSKTLVLITDYKQFGIYGKTEIQKRITSLVWSDDVLLAADKSGDVTQFTLSDEGLSAGKVILGHNSMLLDLCWIKRNFVTTCDRDEKVRVSEFPNAFVIQSFCLGHTSYVLGVFYIERHDALCSYSGDGTIRFWNYLSGAEITNIFHPSCESDTHVLLCEFCNDSILVIWEEPDCSKQHKLYSFSIANIKESPVLEYSLVVSGRPLAMSFSSAGETLLLSAVIDESACVRLLTFEQNILKLSLDIALLTSLGLPEALTFPSVTFKKELVDNVTPYFEMKEKRMSKKKSNKRTSEERSEVSTKASRTETVLS